MFTNFAIFYHKFPYISPGLTTSVLVATGDLIAQMIIARQETFDWKRSSSFLIIGFINGVMARKWYGLLDQHIKNPRPVVKALQKVAGDFFKLSAFI